MENGYSTSCKVCKKSFSGPTPARQHFESEAHKKKVKAEDKMFRGEFSTSCYCDVCNIFCDTPLMLEKHKASPRHMATDSKSKQFKNPGNQNGYMQTPVHDMGRQISNRPIENCTNQNYKTVKEYYFDGSRGYCNICNIELTSYAHTKQHLNGKNHTKAKTRQQFGPTDPNVHLSCNACDVVFSGPECAKQHFESDKHKKRTQQNLETNLSSVTTACPSSYDCSTSFMPTENLVHLSKNGCNTNNRDNNNMYSALPGDLQNIPRKLSQSEMVSCDKPQRGDKKAKDYEFDGNRGYCFVCNIELTSQAHASQHLLGHKHKKQAEKDFKPPGTNARHSPFSDIGQEYTFNGITGYCYVCKIDLTSEAHTNQHISGKNHKKAAEQRKNITSGNQLYRIPSRSDTTEGEDESIICTVEGTVTWYTCTVCICRVNSLEQLRLHKESPKHRHQIEKKLGSTQQLPVQNGNIGIKYSQVVPTSPRDQDIILQSVGFSSTGFTGSNLADELYFPPVPISEEFIDIPTSHDSNLPVTTDPKANDGTETELFREHNTHTDVNNLPFPSVNRGCISGLTDTPSLNINSFRNDSQMAQETYVKKTFAEVDDTTMGFTFDMTLNERINEKDEPYKSLIQFDTVKGVSPNVEMFQFKSGFSALQIIKEKEDEISVGITESSMPDPDSMLNVKGKKDLENYCKKDVENNSGEIIEPEVNMESPLLIAPKTVSLNSDTSEEYEIDSRQSGGGRRKTTGSEMARAMKNRPKQVRSLGISNTVLDSEEEEFVSCVSSFEKLNVSSHSSDKFNEISFNDTHDQQIPVSGSSATLNVVSPDTFQQLHTVNTPKHKTVNENSDDTGINPYRFHKYYCATCKRPMNSEKAMKDHLQGRAHLQKVAEEKAPMRSHPAVVKELYNYGQQSYYLTETSPRSYQIELFGKAMEKDSICFLPTGTGKTLISCMVISAMLEHNPSRQILFLVDKVLLVLQQAKYIKKELGNRIYRRFDTDDISKMIERKLKIAELCGGQQTTGGVPLWKHDIIVITAAFCENLLGREIIRWEDQCLVVFDEAHHCVKSHPFNKLLVDLYQKRHRSLPKILGLTASPAGRKTLPLTIQMLNQLTSNMGGTEIAIVETNQQELKGFQSNADIVVSFKPMTAKETLFKEALEVYLLHCYLKLATETDINQNFNININALQKRNLSEKELKEVGREVVSDILELQDAIVMAHPKGNAQADRLMVDNLKQHTKHICMVLNVMAESGVPTAVEELQELSAGSLFSSFEFAESIGLPCQPVIDKLETCLNVTWGNTAQAVQVESSSQFRSLVDELIHGGHVDWRNRKSIVLILVKQRCTAKSICRQLQSDEKITQRHLNVVCVVGHGSGSEEQGMSVAQQKRVLEEIKAHKHQIVVATSVAEEGIDLPECELVISLNPPSTVTALVQMRGRARKRNSKFIVLCTNEGEKAKLKELMLREENMIKACNLQVISHNMQLAKPRK